MNLFFRILIIFTCCILLTYCHKSDIEKEKYPDLTNLFSSADRIIQSRTNLDSLLVISEIIINNNKHELVSDLNYLGLAYKYKGIYYYFTGEFSDAASYYDQAIKIFIKTNNYLELNRVYSNQGLVLLELNEYEKALENLLYAAKIDENYLDGKSLDRVYVNIGNTYFRINNIVYAHDYFLKAQVIANKYDNLFIEMNALINLISTYSYLNDFENAIVSALRAEKIAISNESYYYLGTIYNNLATVYETLNEHEKSFIYYKKSFDIREQINEPEELIKTIGNIIASLTFLSRFDEAEQYRQLIYSLSEENQIKLESFKNFDTIGDYYFNISNYRKAAEIYKQTLITSLTNFDLKIHQQIADLEKKYDSERKDIKIDLLEKESELNRLKYQQQQYVLIFFVVFLVLILLLIYVVIKMYINKTKDNILINRERDISEKLLLNILPVKVLNDLREKGYFNPEVYNECSVMFADFVNFTKISEQLSPKTLFTELNVIFTAFDNIFSKHECERIKTNGDAYIGVCGLPERVIDNNDKLLQAAIEMIKYLDNRNNSSEIKWEIRIGLHSGPVIGAITGIKKYVFDIFGDTVNISSRLQEIAEPMEILISENFFSNLKIVYPFKHKENIKIKGKADISVYSLNKKGLYDL